MEISAEVDKKGERNKEDIDVAFRFASDRSKIKSISAKDVFDKANADPNHPYRKVIDEATKTAALMIALFQNMVDPDIIVLGGSIPYNQDRFVKEIKKEAERYIHAYMVVIPEGINLAVAKLGGDNGFMGAAGLLMPR